MFVGAIDIGGTKTLVGIVDECGRVIQCEGFATMIFNYEKHLTQCLDVLDRLLKAQHISIASLYGLGITVPGMVDYSRSQLIYAPFANWKNILVKQFFYKKTGLDRIIVENDVNACALGEMTFGHGERYNSFLWMTVSTGVGGAAVNEGKLIRGTTFCAGEVGHLKVEYDVPEQCPCGQLGCLEAHGSGTAISRYTREAAVKNPPFATALKEHELEPDAVGCAELATLGNPHAIKIYEMAGMYLGRGISSCINILNPQAIIIGGGVSRSLDLLMPSIVQTVKRDVLTSLQHIEIVKTRLDYNAALLGAAALILT